MGIISILGVHLSILNSEFANFSNIGMGCRLIVFCDSLHTYILILVLWKDKLCSIW
jgi:hypothetical protein